MSNKNFKPKPRFSTSNNSTGIEQKKLLQLLQKMIIEKSGSVTFVFENYRLNSPHKNNPKMVRKTWSKKLDLNPQVFENKSPNDLINLFESIREDWNATNYKLYTL